MSNKPRKGGKKNRKYGRNKAFCVQYRADNREERNRKRRIARHERRMQRAAQRHENALR